jgi:hypothetical protein
LARARSCSSQPFEACRHPGVDVTMITATTKTFRVKLTDLANGMPTAGVDPREILGFEWLFTWPGEELEFDVDVTLDDVKLVNIP